MAAAVVGLAARPLSPLELRVTRAGKGRMFFSSRVAHALPCSKQLWPTARALKSVEPHPRLTSWIFPVKIAVVGLPPGAPAGAIGQRPRELVGG